MSTKLIDESFFLILLTKKNILVHQEGSWLNWYRKDLVSRTHLNRYWRCSIKLAVLLLTCTSRLHQLYTEIWRWAHQNIWIIKLLWRPFLFVFDSTSPQKETMNMCGGRHTIMASKRAYLYYEKLLLLVIFLIYSVRSTCLSITFFTTLISKNFCEPFFLYHDQNVVL